MNISYTFNIETSIEFIHMNTFLIKVEEQYKEEFLSNFNKSKSLIDTQDDIDSNGNEIIDDNVCSCGCKEFTIVGCNKICVNCNSVIEVTTFSKEVADNESKAENELFKNIKSKTTSNDRYKNIPHAEIALKKIYDEIMETTGKYINEIKKYNITKSLHTEIIANTVRLYKEIYEEKNHRNPPKTAILAICFNYVSKENFIYWSKKELAKMFNMTQKHITKGNNKVNKLASINHEFRKLLNRRPLVIFDILEEIKFKFGSKLSSTDIQRLTEITNRISELPVVLKNTPRPIMGGLFAKFVKVYDIKNISNKDIIQELNISSSSINKYSKLLGYMIYPKEIVRYNFI